MQQVNKPDGIDCDTPVTIIVKRRPKPDRIKDFEQVMSDVVKHAMTFKGHLGANVIQPTNAGDCYRIVYKFDSMRNYVAWEGSELRQQSIERFADVSLGEQELEVLSGLETWFTLPGGEALVPPPKYKMMVVWLSIFPLLLLFRYLVAPLLSELHIVTQITISSIIMVVLMTYVVMPLMSKMFHRWLHSGS